VFPRIALLVPEDRRAYDPLMRMTFGLLAMLVACGDDRMISEAPDAAVRDAAPDSEVPTGCDYTEQRDLTNDDVASGTPEETELTFTTRTVVCGTIDHTHFDGDITVDVDGFVIDVAAEVDVLVRLHGAGAETIELVGVDVYTGPSLDQLVGTNTFYGDHAVTAIHLAPGRHELLGFALAGAAIAAPVAYRIEVVADLPATRCPEVTTGGYPEAIDGATNDGNDMIRLASGSPPSLSPLPTDLPEPTQLVLAPGANTRVTGSAAAATVPDTYEDKDTFAITTGSATNELAVRLDWPTATANLDYFLFEADSADPIVRAQSTTARPEVRTFSVKPGTGYWLLVGAKVGATGLPAAYTGSLCGATFTP